MNSLGQNVEKIKLRCIFTTMQIILSKIKHLKLANSVTVMLKAIFQPFWTIIVHFCCFRRVHKCFLLGKRQGKRFNIYFKGFCDIRLQIFSALNFNGLIPNVSAIGTVKLLCREKLQKSANCIYSVILPTGWYFL